jgi:hypothetical protein
VTATNVLQRGAEGFVNCISKGCYESYVCSVEMIIGVLKSLGYEAFTSRLLSLGMWRRVVW